MKKRKRILLITGICIYCLVAIIVIRGDGTVSRAERYGWQTAHVPATVQGPAQTYSGPGVQFDAQDVLGAGENITALSVAYDGGNWIQAEYDRDGEKRRAYMDAALLDAGTGSLPAESIQRDSVIVNRSVYAYRGPGYEYTMYREQIRYGTEGCVWQSENGFAQLEFTDSQTGTRRRVWVPENALEAPNG